MIKGSIQEEDITIINIYSPSIGAPQYGIHVLRFMGSQSRTQLSDWTELNWTEQVWKE